MNFQKIVKIAAALLGVLGVVFLFRIIGAGDEEIKMEAAMGDFGTVSPLISIAQIILMISIAATVIFSLLNLFADSQKLKKALISVGFLAVVVGLAFALSSGVETPLKDGEVLSASGARWVETGIRVFYYLAIFAIGAMGYSGIKSLINR
jgi:Flp pilus assembly protein protease CpaA